jgi:ADP-heptose:LPS heptosyltransferase
MEMYKIINRRKRVATAAADIVGSIIFGPKQLFQGRRVIKTEEIKDILVIRTAYIGDVVMTLPILRPLKERFPGSRISFLTATGAGEVLTNNPYVDEVITYDPFWFYQSGKSGYRDFIKKIRKKSFDLIIEARGDIRELLLLVMPLKAKYKLSYDVGGGGYLLTHVVPYPGLRHKVEYHLDLVRYLGCETGVPEWGIYLTDEEKSNAEEIIALRGLRTPFVSSHPGSRLPLKRWLPERYAIVYDRIMDELNMPLALFGTAGEKQLLDGIVEKMKNRPVVFAGDLTLRQMAGLIGRSGLFICNDSAPMHIAAAMNTPTVAIFGPSKSIETGPFGSGHKVVEKDFPCRYTCDEGSCRHERYNACMQDITVEDVFGTIKDSLKEALR